MSSCQSGSCTCTGDTQISPVDVVGRQGPPETNINGPPHGDGSSPWSDHLNSYPRGHVDPLKVKRSHLNTKKMNGMESGCFMIRLGTHTDMYSNMYACARVCVCVCLLACLFCFVCFLLFVFFCLCSLVCFLLLGFFCLFSVVCFLLCVFLLCVFCCVFSLYFFCVCVCVCTCVCGVCGVCGV